MLFQGNCDCVYSSKGKAGDSPNDCSIPFAVPLEHYACFSATYTKIRNYNYSEVTYRVYLYKENLENKAFNLCTLLETKKILRCLQKVVPFSYNFQKGTFKINEYSKELTEYNIIELTIKGNYYQHLFVTTMLRCFFEFPYNVAAKEACQLQSQLKNIEDVNLEKVNWINLYLTICCQLGSGGGHGLVESGYAQPKLRTYKEWNHYLASLKYNGQYLFKRIKETGKKFSRDVEDIRISSQEEYDKGVQSRASKYVIAYKDKLSWKK